ncbi:MAG: hypothetical protein HY904_04875 [Deltaproteobacteria bacterium]|nr:hypothetical protein [Deltaproteobacteria bacterium]
MPAVVRAAVAVVLAAPLGCGLFAGDQVAMGAARLTVRNVGAIATLVNDDTACGFKSPAVLAAVEYDGALGRTGTATLRVLDCRIELPEEKVIRTTCLGEETRARGTVVVNAVRRVHGLLSGGAETPAIPDAPDAVSVELEVTAAAGFRVADSTGPETLEFTDGTLTAVVRPGLAAAADSGACAIATPNAQFSAVQYGASHLRLHTERLDFLLEVTGSSLDAQNGRGPGGENALTGSITLAIRAPFEPPAPSRRFALPTRGEDAVLDPDYDAARFKERYACTENLAQPESTQCADLAPRVVDGAARLTIKLLGSLAAAMNADHDCGFASDAVQQAAVVTGTAGGAGTATQTLSRCVKSYREGSTVATDCQRVRTLFSGGLEVSGTKVIHGTLTGNPQAPAIPADDQSVTITLDATFTDFHLGTSADDTGLTVTSGRLQGVVHPRTARAESSGQCAISSPIARFDNVQWTDGELRVHSAAGALAVTVAAGTLQAVNGAIGAEENALSGTLRADGVDRSVPSDGNGLNPDYGAEAFEAAWSCAQDLALPVSFTCNP